MRDVRNQLAELPNDEDKLKRFEEAVLPHLPAAVNLALWLTRGDQDAEDLVQEAYLRALRFFDGFQGGDCRPWLLTIVRNTCYGWLKKQRPHELTAVFDEAVHSDPGISTPETLLLEALDAQTVKNALERLPLAFREVIVLREIEGLSYRQISEVTEVPIGTVMSRLARGRKRLQEGLAAPHQGVLGDL